MLLMNPVIRNDDQDKKLTQSQRDFMGEAHYNEDDEYDDNFYN